MSANQEPAWHLTGMWLPEREPLELWVADGRISAEPIASAETICRDAWILPGLVDAHCHIGLGPDGAISDGDTIVQALADRDAGTLLVRDAGVPTDTHWLDDRADIPRIVRAGRHIARPKRYLPNYAVEIEPEQLVSEVINQARRGDGWVKLVGDWIDRSIGDLAPLWPADIAAEAIAAAHREGARVTAHCFAEQSVQELVRAGIDCIEHGTGLDAATIDLMAERQVALVPTCINLLNFPVFAKAGDARFPTYAAHMRALFGTWREMIGSAIEAGVPVFAGTDAGGMIPHGMIAAEIEMLAGLGGASFALGAASWRARDWLGVPVAAGTSADLVVYSEDPEANPSVTQEPLLVMLRGQVFGR